MDLDNFWLGSGRALRPGIYDLEGGAEAFARLVAKAEATAALAKS